MPRRSTEGHDLILDGVGYRIAARVRGGYGPQEIQARGSAQDVPVMWPSFHAGGGYSKNVGVEFSYSWGENVCTRIPGVVTPAGLQTPVTPIPANTGAITCYAWWNGDLYLGGGRNLLKMAGGTAAPTVVRDFGAPALIESLTVFRWGAVEYLYVGGTGFNLAEYDGAAFTDATFARRLGVTNYMVVPTADDSIVAGDRLLMTMPSGRDYSYTADDPMDETNWAGYLDGGIPVLGGKYPIRSLAASPRHTFFGTTGGLVDVDQLGHSSNLTPYWTQNGKNATAALVMGPYAYIRHAQGIDCVRLEQDLRPQYSAGFCGWGTGVSNETPIRGDGDLFADGGWLGATHWNGTDSAVVYGKRRGQDAAAGELAVPGMGPMSWHGAEVWLPGERITRAFVTAPGDAPRLMVASLAGSTPMLRWVSLPSAGSPLEELLAAGAHRFQPDWQIDFSRERWGDGNSPKVLTRYDCRGRFLSPTASLTVSASAEGGAYEQQGPAIITGPRSTLFPVDPLTRGYEIGLRLNGSGTTTVPAVLDEFKARAEVLGEQWESVQYTLDVSPEASIRSGPRDRRSPDFLWNHLVGLMGRGPIVARSHEGSELLVRVSPGIGWDWQRTGNNLTQIKLVTVNVTTQEVLSIGAGARVARYDQGATYDSGVVYQ